MSFFFIRVWVAGSDIVAVSTGEGVVSATSAEGSSTFIDAVAEDEFVDAGTLLPTLTYENGQLSSSLVTLLPAKDVLPPFAQVDYEGQPVYNWNDGNKYQWNGNAWGASSLSAAQARAIADQSFTDNFDGIVITYDDFSTDVTDLFDSIAANLGQLTEDTVALESDVTTLQVSYTTLDGQVTANATAVSGLETRVTETEDAITVSASQITQLSADLTDAETNISGNATAISGLDTRVTNTEGEIVAQASAITSLETTVGENTTSITEAITSINGIEGKYGVTIDNNGSITGFQLLSGVGGSAFNVRADQFAVFNNTGAGGDNPFTVFTSTRVVDGVSYPAGTYIQDAYIDNAAIVSASIGTLKLGENAATVGNFSQLNPTLDPANYIPGAGFSTPIDAATATVTIPVGQTADIFVALNLRHGYISTPTQWGYRIRRNNGSLLKVLTERSFMTATNDFPVVTYLETVTNTLAIPLLIFIYAQWYGQNSNIELQDATLSLIARYK